MKVTDGNLKKFEFWGILVLICIGSVLIVLASNLSVDLISKIYFFEIEVNTENGELRTLNYFLWKHDFTLKKGSISFVINFDEKVDHMVIDFPDFTKNVNLIIFDCETYFSCDTKFDPPDTQIILMKFIENPVNNPKHTTLMIKNFPDLKGKKIVIEYDMDIIPNGLFILSNPKNILSDQSYAINLLLGKGFECEDDCLTELDGFAKSVEGTKNNIKLKLNESQNSNWRKFKIETLSESVLFWKNLCYGLGISLLGSSIILLFRFSIDNLKGRKNKQLLVSQLRLFKKLLKHIRRKM